jgi:hypothetical protein
MGWLWILVSFMEMVMLIVVCAVLLLAFHLVGRWVRDRCEDIDFGLFGPHDTAPHSSS